MKITPTVIDLYHGDDVTSFEAMAKAGIERVIHKATEGETEVDPAYASRMPEALAAGLQWEAYHFWRPDDPQKMADNFLAVVQGGDPGLPAPSKCWLDYEESGGTPENIMAVMQAVNDATVGTMGLYTTKSLAEALAEEATGPELDFFKTCPLWLAEPGVKKPALAKHAELVWPKICLWQYTWSGRIAGVKGKCDLNCVPEAA